MSDYVSFLARKTLVTPALGFDPVAPFPVAMKPFQKDIVTWACRRSRAAVFADTGLGKTLQELSFATQVNAYTQGSVLLFTTLGVAEQMVTEATKFGIDGVGFAARRHLAMHHP